MMVLKPSGGQSELHRCMVHQVMRDSVAVKMSKRTAEAWLVHVQYILRVRKSTHVQ